MRSLREEELAEGGKAGRGWRLRKYITERDKVRKRNYLSYIMWSDFFREECKISTLFVLPLHLSSAPLLTFCWVEKSERDSKAQGRSFGFVFNHLFFFLQWSFSSLWGPPSGFECLNKQLSRTDKWLSCHSSQTRQNLLPSISHLWGFSGGCVTLVLI